VRRLILLVCLLVAVDLTAWAAVVPLLPHYRAALGISKVQSGWLLATFSAAVVITSIPVGHLADRLGARRVTAGGGLAMAVATLGLGYAGSFWTLVAARALQGVGDAAVWGAGLAWLAARAPADERGRAVSYSNVAAIAGVTAGPFVGGTLTSIVGIRPTFTAVAAITAALAVWALVEPDAQAHPDRRATIRAALRAAVAEPLITAGVVMILAVSIVGGALQVLAPLHLAADGVSRGAIGAVYSVGALLGAGAIIVSARAGDRIGRSRLAAGACAALGVLAILLAVPMPAAPYAALVVAVGPVQSILFSVGYPMGADGADRAGLGHGIAIGLINLTWGVGAIAGPVAGSAIASSAGDSVSYAIMGCLSGAACLAILTMRARADRGIAVP
jgi:DHA1 family solute carrier family 18 vesicular amine transporter 1/2